MILDARHRWVLIERRIDGSLVFSCRICAKKEDFLPIAALIRNDIARALAKALDDQVMPMMQGTSPIRNPPGIMRCVK